MSVENYLDAFLYRSVMLKIAMSMGAEVFGSAIADQ